MNKKMNKKTPRVGKIDKYNLIKGIRLAVCLSVKDCYNIACSECLLGKQNVYCFKGQPKFNEYFNKVADAMNEL